MTKTDDLRQRACAAVIRNGRILMVRQRHAGREFWTLPGGGLEPDESPEQATLRELREETGLEGRTSRLLYRRREGVNETYCFLVEADGGARLGADPELAADAQVLSAVRWTPLAQLADDLQVGLVIAALEGKSPAH